jgi:chitodextrinase
MTDNTGGRLAGEHKSLLGAKSAPVGAAPITRVRALLGPQLGWKAVLMAVALVIGAVGPAVSTAGPQHPKLHSMTPDSGPPGTVVVFEGKNLEPLLWVEFAGTPAEFRSISSERFEAIVPQGATKGRVTFATDLRRVWGPVFKPTEGDPPPPPPPSEDREAPSAPTNVHVTSATQASVAFAWDASTDNVGVAHYGLYRDGSLTGTTTGTTTTYNGLPCGRSFTFGVNAVDAAGNRSGITTVNASTAACPPSDDTTPPSAPGNLRSTGATQTSVSVAWNASSDDVGVTGYALFRNGTAAGTTTATGATFSGLTCGTTYSFGVEAYDAAGNRSPRSSVDASTSACSGPPPPPPPPPPGGGTTITLTDTFWRCTRPISEYAENGLPLRVVMLYTHNYVPPTGAGAVQLGEGCAGDGTNATDLILDIRGDGRTYGPGDDAIRIMNSRPGASNLQIEGRADCGGRVGSAHQDGIQVLGGTNVTFRNFEIGDYDAGLATCQGAGGAFFYSLSSTNTRVEGGKYIACNHALFAGTEGGHVANAMFRSGRTDGSDPVCVGYAASDPCMGPEYGRGVTVSGLTCQAWERTQDRWEAR